MRHIVVNAGDKVVEVKKESDLTHRQKKELELKLA